MSPATRRMADTVLRLLKGIVKALEDWLHEQPIA